MRDNNKLSKIIFHILLLVVYYNLVYNLAYINLHLPFLLLSFWGSYRDMAAFLSHQM